MQKFLDGLRFTPQNPPNAALVVDSGGDQDVLLIELFDPVFDGTARTLTYRAHVLTDYGEEGLAHIARQQTDFTLPEQFDEGGLFLDSCGNHTWGWDGESTGELIGTVSVGYCYHRSEADCRFCHDPKEHCAEAYLDRCLYQERDSQGNIIAIGYTCRAYELNCQPHCDNDRD